jgi:D-arginine dehydrogenase
LSQKGEKVVVIGAGLAGAATAFGLVRRGMSDVLVLEQEAIPGFYASGRNAAMVRQLGSAPEVRRLVRMGLSFFEVPPPPFPGTVGFKRVGSLLLASGKELAALHSWVEADAAEASAVRFLNPEEAAAMAGAARPESFEGGACTATDGVADIHGLLHGFLAGVRAGGGEVRFNTRVLDFSTGSGRIAAVRTDAGEHIACSMVVNAAGPWAGGIGETAGATRLPFLTYRRHLAQTGPIAGVDPSGPFVWNISCEVYFRPESGGLLLSPCDEDAVPPGDPAADGAAIDLLARKVAACFPGLRDAEIRRSWACIRTFVADRHIVLGEDPKLRNFFWAAALGGNGVGLAPMLSYLMPDLILNRRTRLLSKEEQNQVSPARFR